MIPRLITVSASAVLVIPMLLGVFWDHWPLDSAVLFLKTLPVSLAATLALVLALARANQDQAWPTKLMLRMAGAITAVLSIGLFTSAALANNYLDHGPSSQHRALVEAKYLTESSSPRHSHYQVYVRSWRPGKSSECLSVDEAMFQRLRPQASQLIVTSRPGKLGFEWVEFFEAAP